MKVTLLFLFFTVIFSANSVFSQSDVTSQTKVIGTSSVDKHGNPITVSEVPEYVQQWQRDLQTARHNDDFAKARELQTKIDEFQGVKETDNSNLPIDKPIAEQIFNSPEKTLSDWYGSDVSVYTGALKGDGYRQLALINGDDGNLYVVINTNETNSTTRLYRSTNTGVTWAAIGQVTFGSNYAQSVNIAYADSGSVNRITSLICYGSQAPPTRNGAVWYVSWRTDGSLAQVQLVQNPPAGYGFRNPSIITDGLYYSPAGTYFYGAYEMVNSTTGAGNGMYVVRSVSFGTSWTTYRNIDSTYTDQFPIIELKQIVGGAESLYVASIYQISATNTEVQLEKQSFSNMGASWSYAFPLTGSNYRRHGFAVRHSFSTATNNQMLITYARNDSGFYSYSNNAGQSFTINNSLAFGNENPVGFTNCVLDSSAVGSNYAKAVFISNGDSVIYRGGVLGSLGSRILVNSNVNSNVVVPSVSSYRNSSTTCGAVVYAGTGPLNVYYDSECLIIGIQHIGTEIPKEFTLNQNYPNPFNPTTNIKFSVPKSAAVKLTVFDITGKEVAVLVNENLQAGTYNYDFDASNIASGVYFYKIESNEFTAVKKMLLVK